MHAKRLLPGALAAAAAIAFPMPASAQIGLRLYRLPAPDPSAVLTAVVKVLDAYPFSLSVSRRDDSVRGVVEIRDSPLLKPYRENVRVRVDVDPRPALASTPPYVDLDVDITLLVHRRTEPEKMHPPTRKQSDRYQGEMSSRLLTALTRLCKNASKVDSHTVACDLPPDATPSGRG